MLAEQLLAHACRFINTDLAAVNRSITPWVVVNGHRPIYTTSTSGGSITSVIQVSDDLRNALEDIFYKYQVRIHPQIIVNTTQTTLV